ncbi:hypothetical protein [Klebsiella oxytoca]|uniref:hypothetical protein n=1 Tax=Klebsiella oxytoca TaxID=571 RepID=UPI00292E73CA|nr:hypothetical protein [Klebsiella oxytoca]
MKFKLPNILVIIVSGLFSIPLIAGNYFYSGSQTYSCSGKQKFYLNEAEFMNMQLKINVYKEKVSMSVKGTFHQADGTKSNIYRQGIYQYNSINDKLYEAKLLTIRRFFIDNSPEILSKNIFGIEVGQSRNFRMQKIRNDLMVFGSEYTWLYICQLID